MDVGKRWEKNIKDSLGKYCIRLYDTTNGFTGIANPCDFIYYKFPNIVLLEAKSVANKRLHFGNISDNQYNQLLKYSRNRGCLSVIFVYFREVCKGYLIPISIIQSLKEAGAKSISYEECDKELFIEEITLNKKIRNVSFSKEEFDDKIYTLWGLMK